MSFLDLFRRPELTDGESSVLEAPVRGIATEASIEASAWAGRRERNANDGTIVIHDALGAKLMHGWLQNRHQTLMPLTFNVGKLSLVQRSALAEMLASFLLLGRSPTEAADFAPTLRNWLGSVGGDVDTLVAYDRALVSPLPLNQAFETAQGLDLSIYAYVAALMASDTRYPVSIMLCDMVQARFDLSSAIVRSAARRYRR